MSRLSKLIVLVIATLAISLLAQNVYADYYPPYYYYYYYYYNQPLTLSIWASPTSGDEPLTVNFRATAGDRTSWIKVYYWDFGDGNKSSLPNPTHTYDNPGNYVAKLTVIDTIGFTASDSVSIKVAAAPVLQPPNARVSANPTSGDAPLAVYFSAGDSDADGHINAYSWNFGDGDTSSLQNPTHTYDSPGSYVAKLTVTDNNGLTASDSVSIKVAAAPVLQPPNARVSANPTSGDAPLAVYFSAGDSDADGGLNEYSWDFGDGRTSSLQNPTHTYDTPGSYVATLTVTDSNGLTASDSVSITVSDPSDHPEIPLIPSQIRFQARLADSAGIPLNGTFGITFKLYDTGTGGIPIWEEIQDVYVEEGILDVELGSVTALDLPFDRQYWLGVEVESDGEMTPRFKFTTVPYSFTSGQ